MKLVHFGSRAYVLAWLAFPAIGRAATYYVDGANPNASDANPGSAAAPYRSIAAAVAARGGAGTIILVKPAIYRERVVPAASGTQGAPFIMRATGAGVVIDASDDFSSPAKWTSVGGSVYLATSVTVAPIQVFADGQRLASSSASPAAMPARTFQWVGGAGLYVNTGGSNPSAHQTAVGVRDYGFDLSARSWITIDGFEVRRTNDRGIYLANANHVTLIHNTIAWAYKFGIMGSACIACVIDSNVVTDNLDHGIYLGAGATGCWVRANEVARNAKPGGAAAQGIYVSAGAGNLVERNRLHDNLGSGLVVYAATGPNVSRENLAWHNRECGFRASGAAGTKFLDDVAQANGQQGFSLEGSSTGVVVENCIATDNGLGVGGYDLAIASSAFTGLVSDYNLWWNSNSQPPFLYGASSQTTIAAFRSVSGLDTNSGQSDPRFVDAPHGDFHVLAGSPAIDAATASDPSWPLTDGDGLTRLDDLAVPNTGAGTPRYADRGAFEYRSPHPPVAALDVRLHPLGAITDPDTVLTVPDLPRPTYLSPQVEPTFGGRMMRIAGNSGASLRLANGAGGSWGTDSRHHYSTDQPWNSDGTLISIDNNNGSPIELYLDGTTYVVRNGHCSNYLSGDDRWHPSPLHPHERINCVGDQLMWFDVVNCVQTRSWLLPFPVPAIGGDPSNDGRFIALSDSTRVFVVDMDPQPPFAAYPVQRIGPVLDVSQCGLTDGCGVGWVSISASGHYVVVKYLNDQPRVFDVDPATLALTPHPMPAAVVQCTGGDPSQGWIYDLGHPDMALDPYDDDEDVIVGQEHCSYRGRVVDGQLMGGVVKVRLRDGAVTSLTDPTNEARPHHVSARNTRRPGWVYVDYYPDPGERFDDEIVAVKMDGSHSVQRFAHKHTLSTGCYRCESHAVPSLDGRRVIWASNWSDHCVNCGSTSDIRDYVVEAPQMFDPDTLAKRTVTLDGSRSIDPDGTIASYRFGAGDGAVIGPQFGAVATHDYAAGVWRASLTATDNLGAQDSASVTVVVPRANRPPNGIIVAPASNVTMAVGQSLTLTGSAFDPDSPTPPTVLWDLGGGGPNFTVLNPGAVTFARIGTFVVRLLATDANGLDDPTPDSVIVTVTPTNGRAPIVTAPLAATGTELRPLSISVTASDPDGDPIRTLAADLSSLPAGDDARFVANTSNTSGTLTWTPSSTSGGPTPYTIIFTASNLLSGHAATRITIADGVGPNLSKNPSFESGASGWIATGNGVLTTVNGGEQGARAAQVVGPIAPGMFGINDSPNVVATTLAAGIRYRFAAWVRSDVGAGAARLRVREYSGGSAVGPVSYSAPVPLSTAWRLLSLDFLPILGGSSLDFNVLDDPKVAGETFQVDNVSVVVVPVVGASATLASVTSADSIPSPPSLAPLQMSISPHPVDGATVMRFATSGRGHIVLTLHDLTGRRVRTLIDDEDAPAGIHSLRWSPRESGRTPVWPGIYFWRLSTTEGSSAGHLVILE